MRFFGLGAKVMQKHGVVTRQLPPGEILEALKNGTLDATEFSLPAMDQPLGFHTVAKYYYFPGWHQQATLFDLYVNKAVWDGLPERHQAIIETRLRRRDARNDRGRRGAAVEGDEGDAGRGRAVEALVARRSWSRSRTPGKRSSPRSRRRTRTSSASTSPTRHFGRTTRSGGTSATCNSASGRARMLHGHSTRKHPHQARRRHRLARIALVIGFGVLSLWQLQAVNNVTEEIRWSGCRNSRPSS